MVKSQGVEHGDRGGLACGIALRSGSLQWLIEGRRIRVPVRIEHNVVIVLRDVASEIIMLAKEAN